MFVAPEFVVVTIELIYEPMGSRNAATVPIGACRVLPKSEAER